MNNPQRFLEVLKDSQIFQNNAGKIHRYITTEGFSGWEVWLQCEIGDYIQNLDNPRHFYREAKYKQMGFNPVNPAYIRNTGAVTNNPNQAAIADFLSTRANGADATYTELKCMYDNDLDNAWARLRNDMAKIQRIRRENENENTRPNGVIFSALVVYQSFPNNIYNSPLSNNESWVYNTYTGDITRLADVEKNQHRTFVYATSKGLNQ